MPLKGKRQVSKIRKLAEVVGSNPTEPAPISVLFGGFFQNVLSKQMGSTVTRRLQ
jgi:hypothetical protein